MQVEVQFNGAIKPSLLFLVDRATIISIEKTVDVLTPVFCGQVAESKEALTTKKKDEKESSDDDDWLTRKDPPVNDEEILAQDEEFLEKARTFEDRWNKGDPSLSIDFPHSLEQTISEEEEDGESLLEGMVFQRLGEKLCFASPLKDYYLAIP
ncbi:unnamed protein product [Protopolystoma xenopodis]|uniref:Uncharacterized protein n=1 Tax=Protopolystoma xenopodis TaxID=117903 RepID=A0A448WHC5_9PLAT|nr:unnamed protein product [Protopolystoma xenopodis]